MTQENILLGIEMRRQRKLLVDHDNAMGDRFPRRSRLVGPAGEQDLAFVWSMHPTEDLHQGRFPGPILADQGMDLAAL